VIGAIIGIGGLGLAFGTYLNARAARFDAFDLNIFKVQLEKSAALIVLVDRKLDLTKRLFDNTGRVSDFLIQLMSAQDQGLGEAGRIAELAKIQPTQQQISTDIAALAGGVDDIMKNPYPFFLVVPSDVGKSLVDSPLASSHRRT
jgi:hypothetical protein